MVSIKNFFLFLFCYVASEKLAVAEATPLVGPENISPLLYGGENATFGEYPYYVQVLLFDNGGLGKCGGTLIAPDLVLTAAHCTFGSENRSVAIALNSTLDVTQRTDDFYKQGGQVIYCQEVIEHEDYVDGILTDGPDVALCLLEEPFAVNETSVYHDLNVDYVPEEDENLTLIGLGNTGYSPAQVGWNIQFIAELGFLFDPYFASYPPENLQKVETLPYISRGRCQTANDMAMLLLGFYSNSLPGRGRLLLTENQICTFDPFGDKSFGSGDSGGPLLAVSQDPDGRTKHTQIGIVSFSLIPVGLTANIYMDVAYYNDWIKTTACDVLESTADFCSCNYGKSGKSDKSCKSGKSSKKGKKSKKS